MSANLNHAMREPVNVVYVTHKVLGDETLLEAIYDPDRGAPQLLVAREGHYQIMTEHRAEGCCYKPRLDGLVRSGHVSAPSEYKQPPDVAELLERIRHLIHRCVDLDDVFEIVAAHYVVSTYVYDRFSRFGYLRLHGNYGTGKSRFLELMAKLCYRGTYLGGAFSRAVLHRTLELYPGTLCLDEADFHDLSFRGDLVKILNTGYQFNGCIWRCADGRNGYEPQRYPSFGPKVLASRYKYEDESLESRILSQNSRQATRSLPASLRSSGIQKEMEELRNLLFGYRVMKWHSISEDEHVQGLEGFDPRTAEILRPLALAAGRNVLPPEIIDYARCLTASRQARRLKGLEALALRELRRFHQDGCIPYVREVAERVNAHNASGSTISDRKMGAVLENLGIKRTHTREGRRVVIDPEHLQNLMEQYGLEE